MVRMENLLSIVRKGMMHIPNAESAFIPFLKKFGLLASIILILHLTIKFKTQNTLD